MFETCRAEWNSNWWNMSSLAPITVCWLWKMTCISLPKLSKKQRPLSTLGLRQEHIWEPVWAWRIMAWVEAPLIPAGNGSYGKSYGSESIFISFFLARSLCLVTLLVYKRNIWASEMALTHHLSSVPGTEFVFLRGKEPNSTKSSTAPHVILHHPPRW